MTAIEKFIQNARAGRFGDNWLGVAEEADRELARLKRIEEAAKKFVNSDGRNNPPELYNELKKLLEDK